MMINRRSFLQFSSLAALCAVMPAGSEELDRPKRILVYGDSNTFGWVYDPKVGVTRLPVEKTWARVMADKLGAGYEVEVNALGGRTISRDQPTGTGSGSRIPGSLFNGMTALPAVLSENLPLDLVIVMLGTNDAKAQFKTTAHQLADDLARMTELIRGDGWGGKTPYSSPQVLLIAPIYQPDDTAYGEFFKGAHAITKALPESLRRKAAEIGAEYLNAGDFVTGVPAQMDRVHMSEEQHRLLGLGVANKVKAIMER